MGNLCNADDKTESVTVTTIDGVALTQEQVEELARAEAETAALNQKEEEHAKKKAAEERELQLRREEARLRHLKLKAEEKQKQEKLVLLDKQHQVQFMIEKSRHKEEETLADEAERQREAEAEKKRRYEGHMTHVRELLRSFGFDDKDVNGKKKIGVFGQYTFPLLEAVKEGEAGFVHSLLKGQADPHMVTKGKKTALHVAEKLNVQGKHDRIIKVLREWPGQAGAA